MCNLALIDPMVSEKMFGNVADDSGGLPFLKAPQGAFGSDALRKHYQH